MNGELINGIPLTPFKGRQKTENHLWHRQQKRNIGNTR